MSLSIVGASDALSIRRKSPPEMLLIHVNTLGEPGPACLKHTGPSAREWRAVGFTHEIDDLEDVTGLILRRFRLGVQ